MSRIDFSKWPAQAEGTQPEASQGRLIVPYLDDSDEIEEIPFLFTLNGSHGLIAAANLHTLQGEKKAGKSALGLALIVAALKGEFIGITPSRPDLSLLWIDTEQDTTTLKLKRRAVLAMAGLDKRPDRLRIVTLRGFGSTADVLQAVLQAIAENAPDLVFLDGVVDLCEAFNDEEKSRAVIRQLEAAVERYGCAILGLIHTNKTSKSEARGHLGAVLQQKSAEIYQVAKDGERTAKVSQPSSRFAPVPDFYFNFADGFRLEPATSPVDKMLAAMRARFAPLFQGGARATRGRLIELYTEAQGCGESKAEKDIKAATDAGILFVEHEGRCAFYSYLFPPLDNEEEEAL